MSWSKEGEREKKVCKAGFILIKLAWMVGEGTNSAVSHFQVLIKGTFCKATQGPGTIFQEVHCYQDV